MSSKQNNLAFSPNILPIEQIPATVCQKLRGIFCDIDDTITTQGKLMDCSYKALWDAHRAGLRVVPITGRPAGWVDHIARMWPVDAVIGENGAFYFWMQNGKMHRYFIQDAAIRASNRARLSKLQAEILAKIPGVAVSADQLYRESDLAIDFCEDVPPVAREKVLQVVQIFHNAGAQAKISSIHVNGWFGEFNKLSTCRLLLSNLFHESDLDAIGNYLFCGDSPNDEPMFAEFIHGVAVANIRDWLHLIKKTPHYITSLSGSEGFAEMTKIILQKRG